MPLLLSVLSKALLTALNILYPVALVTNNILAVPLVEPVGPSVNVNSNCDSTKDVLVSRSWIMSVRVPV